MQRFKRVIDLVLSLTAAVGLVAMMTHVVVNALMRFFWDLPLSATNEIVAFWYLPIIALLGIPAAQLQNEQIVVTLAVDRLKAAAANAFKVFACVVGVLLSIGFGWYGFVEALHLMDINATAGVTDVISWPANFIVPFAFVLLALLLILEIIGLIASWGYSDKSEPETASPATTDPNRI